MTDQDLRRAIKHIAGIKDDVERLMAAQDEEGEVRYLRLITDDTTSSDAVDARTNDAAVVDDTTTSDAVQVATVQGDPGLWDAVEHGLELDDGASDAGQAPLSAPALEFDPTSESYALSLWVDHRSGSDGSILLRSHVDGANGLDWTGSDVRLGMRDASGTRYETVADVPSGQITHVVGVIDAAELEQRLYVDGSLAGTAGYPADVDIETAASWDLGGASRIAGGSANATARWRADDVRLFDSVLADAEVQALASGDDVAAGLVGHWPLDAGAGTRVGDYAGGADATIGSAVAWTGPLVERLPAAHAGNTWDAEHALEVDGSSYLTIPQTTAIASAINSHAFTLSFVWDPRSGLVADGSYDDFLRIATADSGGGGIQIDNDGGTADRARLLWWDASASSHTDRGRFVVDGPTRVTIRVDGDDVEIWTGDTLAESDTDDASTLDGVLDGGTWQVGGHRNETTVWDDLRLFDSVLADAEVQALASGDDVAAGLVGHWPLDAGAGDRAVDRVAGADGTLQNAPAWSDPLVEFDPPMRWG